MSATMPLWECEPSAAGRRASGLGLLSVSLTLYSQLHEGFGSGSARWAFFQNSFIAPDGAVRDTGNGGISHSEGQGYTLLLAVAFNDRPMFERVHAWTRANLAVRPDALHAWRKYPGQPVTREDNNNATDGDLLIAWALLRASAAWGRAEYRREAARILRDLLSACVVEIEREPVLRPGAGGFDRPTHLVVNPSYYIFPALKEIALALPDPRWPRLIRRGVEMMGHARYGRLGLIPDWVAHPRGPGRLTPASGWPARFSWDAVRIPLYMAWGGLAHERSLDGIMEFWLDPRWDRGAPAWWDLSLDVAAPYPAPSGIRAIIALMLGCRLRSARLPVFPRVAASEDYYNCALNLLSRLAWSERHADVPTSA